MKPVKIGGFIDIDELQESVTTYHVHKANLCYGTRCSGYFSSVMRPSFSGKFKEGETSVSRVVLDPLVAEVFPAFLDFLYTERSLNIDNESATALTWLGEYFEVPILLSEAHNFIQQNLSVENLSVYYRHSTKLQVDSVLSDVQTYSSRHILSICPENEILRVASPDFWVDCLTKASDYFGEDFPNEYSLHVSRIVAKISKLHSRVLNRETFDDLTTASIIPVIDCFDALSLCEADDGLTKSTKPNASGESNSDSEPLQKRCANALAEKWRVLVGNCGGELQDDTIVLLESRQSKFLAYLLLKSLKHAEEDYVSSSSKVASLKKKLSNAKNQAQSFQKTVEALRRDLDETRREMMYYSERANNLQKDLNETKRQLGKAKSVVSRFSFVAFNPCFNPVWTSKASYPADLSDYGKVGVHDSSYLVDPTGAPVQLYMFR